jgi:comEA protein
MRIIVAAICFVITLGIVFTLDNFKSKEVLLDGNKFAGILNQTPISQDGILEQQITKSPIPKTPALSPVSTIFENSNPTFTTSLLPTTKTLPTTQNQIVPSSTQEISKSGLININTASLEELDKISGIGPTYAQSIINYRNINGPFKKIEDIVNVKGIGPKTFEKMKSEITI